MSNEDIYAGSSLSKFFGMLALFALLYAVEGLLSLDLGQVVISLIVMIVFSYIGYRCARAVYEP